MTTLRSFLGWRAGTSPFHEGEQQVQSKLGYRDGSEAQGRMVIRDILTQQMVEFYPLLPYVVLGFADPETGEHGSCILCGAPGFVTAPDPRFLHFSRLPLPNEPLGKALKKNLNIGVIGIQLSTRRRNRANGFVVHVDEHGFLVQLTQTFGNCPQYIQAREPQRTDFEVAREDVSVETIHHRLASVSSQVANADTLFISSYHGNAAVDSRNGVDVSHRGGSPGFIRILSGTALTAYMTDKGDLFHNYVPSSNAVLLSIPDFSGNKHFNTIGNIVANPRVSLAIPDFDNGSIIYLNGMAIVEWQSKEVEEFEGAERFLHFWITGGVIVHGGLPAEWVLQSYAPQLRRLGSWKIRSNLGWAGFQELSIESVTQETADVKSIRLSRLGDALPDFKPGQFLPVKVVVNGRSVTRTYTLSDVSDGKTYRISVKAVPEGVASNHLHTLQPGDTIMCSNPRGTFTLPSDLEDFSRLRNIVFLAAGIGITPILAMLKGLLRSFQREPPASVGYQLMVVMQARSQCSAPLLPELVATVNALRGIVPTVAQVYYSQEEARASGGDIDVFSGRITPQMIDERFQSYRRDTRLYMCGPSEFMNGMLTALQSFSWDPEQIIFESFGGAKVPIKKLASMARQPARGETGPALTVATAVELEVAEPNGQKVVTSSMWQSESVSGTLLDIAEDAGISPPYGCRSGSCGTCKVRLSRGRVKYVSEPIADIEDGYVLPCCAIPISGDAITLSWDP